MVNFRVLLVCAMSLVLVSGCLQKSITDDQITNSVQGFLDTPPDPSNANLLTVEERAVVESFTIYKNIIKIQLVEGTERTYWEPAGKKVVRAFALACRAADVLEVQYLGELRVYAELEGSRSNFLIGDIRFENNGDRVYAEMYSISRGHH